MDDEVDNSSYHIRTLLEQKKAKKYKLTILNFPLISFELSRNKC